MEEKIRTRLDNQLQKDPQFRIDMNNGLQDFLGENVLPSEFQKAMLDYQRQTKYSEIEPEIPHALSEMQNAFPNSFRKIFENTTYIEMLSFIENSIPLIKKFKRENK